jgi:hypothetical protein
MALGSIQSDSSRLYSVNSRENKGKARTQDQQNLSEDQRKQVWELKKRDQEVKAHEAAHMAAGGSCVRGGATYSYQVGPDGRRYAVGGEVSIDTSSVRGDPQATITKMQTVRRAALAPADPSGQDRSVASQASGVAAQAQKELAQQRTSGAGQAGNEKPPANSISKPPENAKPPMNGTSEPPENAKPASRKAETDSYSNSGKARSIQESQSNFSFYA